jgi:hypothetical protein
LQKTGASRAVIHGCLAIFILVPVVPLLAAQINYDNMMIPLTALSLLMAVQLNDSFKRHKAIDIRLSLALLSVCLLTSLVKYSFLPIFAVIVLYTFIRLRQIYGGPKQVLSSIGDGIKQTSHRSLLFIGCAFVISSGLFIQRYGVNIIKYHNPIPKCSQVLTIKQCSSYGPWLRDYNSEIIKDNDRGKTSLHDYVGEWFYGMWFRTFFAVDGPATQYETRGPFRVPAQAAIVFLVGGVIAMVFVGRRVFKKYNAPTLWLFLGITVLYLAILWIDDYHTYLSTATPVAINGRYIFPVLPLILVIMALSYGELLKKWLVVKLALLSIAILCMLWGGGALTYILRSRDAWYWTAQPVYDVNHAVQHVVGPLTPGYDTPIEFLHWH